MDVGGLLSALNQSIETATIAQVAADGTAKAQPGPAGIGVAGAGAAGLTGGASSPVLTIPGTPTTGPGTSVSLTVSGSATGPGGLIVPGTPGVAGTLTATGLQTGASATPGVTTVTEALTAGGPANTTSFSLAPAGIAPRSPTITVSADVYYGSGAPASPSLLSQSGVGAYIHLVNALAAHAGDEKSAEQLTNSLGNASATLKSAYYDAVSRLPAPLQAKDWGFSVFNGKLVFTAGTDGLTPQDFADLQKAFAAANSEPAANQLASALTSIDLRQNARNDSASLAWGRIQVDENNFSDVVNLRDYVTSTAPGGRYSPSAPAPETRPQIPNILGGMDLRGLASARPNFFRSNGSVITDTPDPSETTEKEEDLGTLQGQCSCGEVRFAVENTFEYAFYCHCSRCRVRTGSAFAAIAGVSLDKVEVHTGREHLLLEGECSDGYGARCAKCHAFLFAAVRNRQYMHVALGVLGGTPSRLPDHHIYVGSKAPWFEITDTLPQYDELP
ncbi:MAG: hypothetical protein JWL65_2488 [Gammaproteobacteria bacterium]|nr:hypothetical protein [Gammaproteobacteria bacterium]